MKDRDVDMMGCFGSGGYIRGGGCGGGGGRGGFLLCYSL